MFSLYYTPVVLNVYKQKTPLLGGGDVLIIYTCFQNVITGFIEANKVITKYQYQSK